MTLLIILLAGMLLAALSLLAIPLLVSRFALHNWPPLLFLLIFSLSLYYFFGNFRALHNWLTTGRQHYALQQQVEQLGGINGMITQIQQKLILDPTNAEGWFILGKLYLATQHYQKAKTAFTKAHALRPNDQQIQRYYEATQHYSK